MSGAFSSRVYVGRDGEMRALQAAFEQASSGSAGAVLVGGEAGVGKTRLLEELAARAEGDGAVVLIGRCVDLREAAMPLLPIAEALTALGPLPAAADLDDARRRAGAGVVLFAPVLDLLREAAASKPVLLAVDDAHWADRSTLDLIGFLLGRLRDEQLLLVLTFRSDEVDRRAELREFLAEAGRRRLVAAPRARAAQPGGARRSARGDPRPRSRAALRRRGVRAVRRQPVVRRGAGRGGRARGDRAPA